MCFSAAASFTAGAVLTGIGVATLRKVEHPTYYLFASIPLLFAVQQFSEGVLWLTLPSANPDFGGLKQLLLTRSCFSHR